MIYIVEQDEFKSPVNEEQQTKGNTIINPVIKIAEDQSPEGLESNIIKILTWNEIQTLHQKFSPSKTSSKLFTEQGSSLIN